MSSNVVNDIVIDVIESYLALVFAASKHINVNNFKLKFQ